MSTFFFFLICLMGIVPVCKMISAGSKCIQVQAHTKEEAFMEELYKICGSSTIDGHHHLCLYEGIRVPRRGNNKQWAQVVALCERYGYNPDVLFKHKKKPFWNHERYFIGWSFHFDKGSLILEEVSQEFLQERRRTWEGKKMSAS